MILFSGLFTVFSRLIGAVATRTLGWSTVLLFGRVPQARQRVLSLMALGAVVWLIAVLAVLVPSVHGFILSTLPRPGFVPGDVIALALVGAALLIPVAIGIGTLALSPDRQRPTGIQAVARVFRGYPFTAVLAVTIVFLAAWSVERNLRAIQHGWESVHIPMIVKPGRYEAVVDAVAACLAEAGIDATRNAASPWFVVPPRLLAMVGGDRAEDLVPDRLQGFKADGLEALVYPSDVALTGKSELVANARAAVARGLTYADAYLTTAKESEQIEDRLRELSTHHPVRSADFQTIDTLLASLAVPYDEWETLLRLRFQVEHEAGRRRPGTVGRR